MQNAHAFLFNFREIMSKMREFVYFETIFVNSATPSWAKAGRRSPANHCVNGQRGCLFVICFASGAVSESAFAAKIDKWVNR